MSEPKPKLRWFHVRLRVLLIAVAIGAITGALDCREDEGGEATTENSRCNCEVGWGRKPGSSVRVRMVCDYWGRF